jgi:hypothetical protein
MSFVTYQYSIVTRTCHVDPLLSGIFENFTSLFYVISFESKIFTLRRFLFDIFINNFTIFSEYIIPNFIPYW